jgi:hypothetical protein
VHSGLFDRVRIMRKRWAYAIVQCRRRRVTCGLSATGAVGSLARCRDMERLIVTTSLRGSRGRPPAARCGPSTS